MVEPMKSYESADRVLELRLLRYALAAGVTLACQVPAHGEVVFTPSNAVLQGLGKLDIDLDNDGSSDFSILARWTVYDTSNMIQALFAYGVRPSHQIVTGRSDVLPLKKKAPIGPERHFRALRLMETPFYRGSWQGAKSRCIGVRFLINGEVHYGWIGFREVRTFPAVAVKLSGYAYESEPNKEILAGDTGTAARLDSFISPTSLETLAAGHTAIDERRKRAAGGYA